MSRPVVAITRCALESSDAAVEQAVRETIELSGGVPERVRAARRVLIKPNYVGANSKPSDEAIRRHRGRFISCAEPCVTRAVVAMVREANPSAEIILSEAIDTRGSRTAADVFRAMGATELVDAYGVRLIDANEGEIVAVPVPNGGLVHRAVYVNREVAGCDAVVSIAKLKAHGTAGVTMSIKNMFGILPRYYYGSTHRNFMHTNYVRLMRIIVDIATALKPDLAVVDGLVASDHSMDHEPIETNVLFAGQDPVATDAVGAALMNFDPHADFPDSPFVVSENHLRLAAQVGLGTLDLAGTEIRGLSLAEARSSHQFSIQTEMAVTTEQAAAQQQAVAEQAAVYRKRHKELLRDYAGQYVFLHDGKVEWAVPTLAEASERAIRNLPSGHYGLAIQVLPEIDAVEKVAAYA